MPSSTATSAGPCDSPAVSQRNMRSIVYDGTQKPRPAERTGAPDRCVRWLVDHHRVVRPVQLERIAVTELEGHNTVVDRQQLELARGKGVQRLDAAEGLSLQGLAIAVADYEVRATRGG